MAGGVKMHSYLLCMSVCDISGVSAAKPLGEGLIGVGVC